MIPAFSARLAEIGANPAALAACSWKWPAAPTRSPTRLTQIGAGGSGGDALDQVFGSPEAVEKVVQHVAQVSGVSPADRPRHAARRRLDADRRSFAFDGRSGALRRAGPARRRSERAWRRRPSRCACAGSSGGVFGSLISVFGGAHAPANPETAALVAGLAALERDVRLGRAGRPGLSGERHRDRLVVHSAAVGDRRLRADVPSLHCRGGATI